MDVLFASQNCSNELSALKDSISKEEGLSQCLIMVDFRAAAGILKVAKFVGFEEK